MHCRSCEDVSNKGFWSHLTPHTFTNLHLAIDRVSNKAILRILKKSAYNERIRNRRDPLSWFGSARVSSRKQKGLQTCQEEFLDVSFPPRTILWYRSEHLQEGISEGRKSWNGKWWMNHSKRFFWTPDPKNSSGFLTEYFRLYKSLTRTGLSDSDECRLCGEEQIPIHLATESPLLLVKDCNAWALRNVRSTR